MKEKEEITEAIVLPEQLNELATKSGLELSRAVEHAFKFVPQMKEINELSKSLTILNKDNPSKQDVATARLNRLALVKVRGAAKTIKEELKENILTEGRLIDKLFKTIIDTAELSESEYEAIEKHAENLEKERKENLRIQRLLLLDGLTDNTSIYPLSEMSEDAFTELVNGLKLQKEAAEAAIKKAEEERIAKEKAEAEERERIRLENERLKAEAAENERLAAIERKKQAEALAKLEAEKKAAEDKARKEKEAQEAKLKKEREENERLTAELKKKEEAEKLKAKKEAEEIEAKAKAKLEAMKAPDKEKMKAWINDCYLGITPSLGPDAHKKACEIHSKFEGFLRWANEQIDSI